MLPTAGAAGFEMDQPDSNDTEYVDIDSIEPRLYLLAGLIMDVSPGQDR